MVTTACRATSMRSLVRTSRTYAPPSPHRWFVGLICVIRGGEKGLWKEKSAGVATAAMEGTEPKPSGASATSTGTEIDSTPEDGMGVRASAIDDETKVARLTPRSPKRTCSPNVVGAKLSPYTVTAVDDRYAPYAGATRETTGVSFGS